MRNILNPKKIVSLILNCSLIFLIHNSAMAEIEQICGNTTDWQDVELYDGTLGPSINFVNNHQASVGQIVWNNNLNAIYTNSGSVNGARWCSGTLISNNYFLTAGHCFDIDPEGWTTPRNNITGNPISPEEIATNMHVQFNYQLDPFGNLRTEESFDIVNLVEYVHNKDMDYAIVELAGNPSALFPIAKLDLRKPAKNELLTIIQHPETIPKVVEAGSYKGQTFFTGKQMRYADLDTEGGSSGSGILDSNGRLVGVHTTGACEDYGVNQGYLLAHIRPYSNTIKNILNLYDAWYGPLMEFYLNDLEFDFDLDGDGYVGSIEYIWGSDPLDPKSNPDTIRATILVPAIAMVL